MAVVAGTASAIADAVYALFVGSADMLAVNTTDPQTLDVNGNPAPTIWDAYKNQAPPVYPSTVFRVEHGMKLRPFRAMRVKHYFLTVQYSSYSQESDATDKFYEVCSGILDEKPLDLTPFDSLSRCVDCHEVAATDSEEDPVEHGLYRMTVRYVITAGRILP